jgi:hypothetical protein
MSFKGQSHYVMSCLLWCHVDTASKQASKQRVRENPILIWWKSSGIWREETIRKNEFLQTPTQKILNLFARQQTKSKVHCPFATTNRWFEEDWEKKLDFRKAISTVPESCWPYLLEHLHPCMPYTPPYQPPSISVQQCLPVPLGGSFFLSQRVRSGYNGHWAEVSQKLKSISSDPVACDSLKTHWTYPEPPVLSGANPEICFFFLNFIISINFK